ncbi:MAG: STAS domain-containing protein [Mariprofundaceae bacterium]|nr:STAS domain-containing protein [Mariprofundaceae bacterium]
MSKNKKKSMIGHDPLAWIHEDAAVEPVEAKKDEVQSDEGDKQAEQQVKNMANQAENSENTVEMVEKTVNEVETTTVGEALDTAVQTLDETAVTCLQGDLTIQTAHDLHSQLKSALAKQGVITLDAAEVGRVDTAAVQLLYAFVQKTKNMDREFLWKNPSVGLCETATTLGLAASLQLPQ